MHIKLHKNESAPQITVANAKEFAGQTFDKKYSPGDTIQIIGATTLFDGRDVLILSDNRIATPDSFAKRFITPADLEKFNPMAITEALVALYVKDIKGSKNPEYAVLGLGIANRDKGIGFGTATERSQLRPFWVYINPRTNYIEVRIADRSDRTLKYVFEKKYMQNDLEGMGVKAAAKYIHNDASIAPYLE